jgi:hypothetical protein
MSYEILLEGREPIDDWSVCTICLSVDRTAATGARKWRCADCGSSANADTPQALRAYLSDTPTETLETNLRQWGAVKGVRPAYKMLRSARYKCLLTLSRKHTAAQ